jgi:hypothetical protein
MRTTARGAAGDRCAQEQNMNNAVDFRLALTIALVLCAGCATRSHTADTGGDAGTDGTVVTPGEDAAARRDSSDPVTDAEAPDATITPDATIIDPPPPESGIPCGAITCEAGASFCLACAHWDSETPHVHCEPTAPGDWPFADVMESHGCGFPAVFIQCDGSEDCPEGERCVFSGGEWGYAQCLPSGEGSWGVACETDADCGDDLECGETDPFGYFSAISDVLGWMPRACGDLG